MMNDMILKHSIVQNIILRELALENNQPLYVCDFTYKSRINHGDSGYGTSFGDGAGFTRLLVSEEGNKYGQGMLEHTIYHKCSSGNGHESGTGAVDPCDVSEFCASYGFGTGHGAHLNQRTKRYEDVYIAYWLLNMDRFIV